LLRLLRQKLNDLLQNSRKSALYGIFENMLFTKIMITVWFLGEICYS